MYKLRVEYIHQLRPQEVQHYLELGLLDLPAGREAEFLSGAPYTVPK